MSPLKMPTKSLWKVVIITASCQAVNLYAAEEKICTDGTTPVFQCEINNKRNIALCATYSPQKELTGLQYRASRNNKNEFTYPENITNSLGKFKLNHYFRYSVDYIKVGFTNKEYNYYIFRNSDNSEIIKINAGITVSKTQSNSPETEIQCNHIYIDTLKNLIPMLACDDNDALGCAK
jgi:hypothetical protein